MTIIAAVTVRDQSKTACSTIISTMSFAASSRSPTPAHFLQRGSPAVQRMPALRRIGRFHPHQRLRSERREMSLVSREELRRAVKGKESPHFTAVSSIRATCATARRMPSARRRRADAPLREFNETSYSLSSTDVQQAIATGLFSFP